MSRRSPLREHPSPVTLLNEVEPAYRALCLAQVGLLQSSPHSEALRRATEALTQLATDLGHPGRFSTPGH